MFPPVTASWGWGSCWQPPHPHMAAATEDMGARKEKTTTVTDNVAQDICAFCRGTGAGTPFYVGHPDWPWVHSSCAASTGRRKALAKGMCFFCLGAGADMTPYGPGRPDDVPWAHRSCIASYEALLDGAEEAG